MEANYFTPTKELIKEYIREQHVRKLNEDIADFLWGEAEMTEELADLLEKTFEGTPADYWLTYEKKYQEFLKQSLLLA